jgi:hypothetical protein
MRPLVIRIAGCILLADDDEALYTPAVKVEPRPRIGVATTT